MVHITLHLCLLRRAKPKLSVILPARAPTPQKQKIGVSMHLFLIKRQVRGSSHWRPKKNLNNRKRTPMDIHSPTVFLLQLRYRIFWLVVVDLVISRFCIWFIVALAPALFRWPWYLFHSIHPLLVTYVLYRGFLPVYTTPIISDGVASVVPSTCATKVQDTFEEPWRSCVFWPTYDKRCCGDGVAVQLHSTFSLYTFL
jgi:hypothetical protein